MIYNLADFIVSLSINGKEFETKLYEYIISNKCADYHIKIYKNDIVNESKNQIFLKLNDVESICIHRKLAEWLPLHNAFVLHSAVFDVDGTGIALAAHSGTGKTTHMLLWQKLIGDRLKIVNGDKPIVRFFDDEPETPYAYGTPWNGKEHLGCNMRTPLKNICFIERAEKNSCEEISKTEAADLLFNQVYMPKDPQAAINTLQLINRLISC